MKSTRYAQVAEQIENLIKSGALKEGEKIPSLRQLSRELNVSINTVKEAYWMLEDRNYIVAVPQSGFYVKRQSTIPIEQPLDPAQLNPQEVSLCRIYGAFQNVGRCGPGVGLGVAALNPEFWPTDRMGRYFQDAICQNTHVSYNYLMPPGYPELREQIVRWGLSSGLNLSPEEIIITNGCHEAVYLALVVLCKPGDTVVLESPVYFSLLKLLKQLDLKIIEIPSCPKEGINLDTLRFVLENRTVNAMFSISNFNNPVGFLMPSDKKKQLVQLLAEYGVPLIEDDIYGDLSYHQRPDTCKTYDAEGEVLLCSSFSKTIAPGVRIGWIAPGKYYDSVIEMKMSLNISTASINQIAVAHFLKEGGYERHLRKTRKHLQRQVVDMRAAILKYFPGGTKVTKPDGGFLLWVALPKSVNTDDIYQTAVKENILIAPGRLFSMKGKYTHCMRLNAGIWNERVEQTVRYLAELCTHHLTEAGEEDSKTHRDAERAC